MAPSLQLAKKVERMHPHGRFDWETSPASKSLSPLGTAKSPIIQQMPEGIPFPFLLFREDRDWLGQILKSSDQAASSVLQESPSRVPASPTLFCLSNQKSCEAQPI